MSVAGVRIALLSSATVEQLRLLAAAFQLRPRPSSDDLLTIARHVGLPPEQLAPWFESRRKLQEWVAEHPNLQPVDVAKLFYAHASEPAVQCEAGVAA